MIDHTNAHFILYIGEPDRFGIFLMEGGDLVKFKRDHGDLGTAIAAYPASFEGPGSGKQREIFNLFCQASGIAAGDGLALLERVFLLGIQAGCGNSGIFTPAPLKKSKRARKRP